MNQHMVKFLCGTAILICCTLDFFGQNNVKDKLPLDQRVKTGRLQNGLTYYIRQNNIPAKKAELRLVVKAGSILEDDDQLGLAHFTEHMAFNGLKHFKKNELISFLQSIGVRFGDLNANTGYNETTYILPVPTNNKKNLEIAFQILEDWTHGVAFDAEEIDNERGVVLEEMRDGKVFNEKTLETSHNKLLEGSKYVNRNPIGTEESIKNFSHDALKRFYKDWYRPNLMGVIAIGDLDPIETEKLIKKHFSRLKNPTPQRPLITSKLKPLQKTEAISLSENSIMTENRVDIYFSPVMQKNAPVTINEYRSKMIQRLISDMLEDRLKNICTKKDAPFKYASSSLRIAPRGWERYHMSATPNKDAATAMNALIIENERARRFGFTSSEMERVKKKMRKEIQQRYNEKDKITSSILAAEYIGYFLNNEMAVGVENEYALFNKLVDNISQEEINIETARYIPVITDPKLITFMNLGTDFKNPTPDELIAIASKAAKADLSPYKDEIRQTITSLMIPAAGNIAHEKRNSKLGTTELVYGNGVKVILKPTDFAADEIILRAYRSGGTSIYNRKESCNANAVAAMLMGAGKYTFQELLDFSNDKGINASMQLHHLADVVTGQSNQKNLESMLELIYLHCAQPRKDTAAFNAYISRNRSSFAMRKQTLDVKYTDAVSRVLYNNHPWAEDSYTPEELDSYNVDRVLEIYKERFGNANGFTFVLVGKFDVELVKPLLATYLGGLPSAEKPSSFKDVGLRPITGPLKKDFTKGSENYNIINFKWNGETNYSGEEQLALQALMGVLKIKFLETLREKLSGVYDVSVYGGLAKHPYENFFYRSCIYLRS